LSGYFIADDTWQLQFAYRVLNHGEWPLLTGNFMRSYLSLPSMDFYRPLLGFSYLADYALYGVNAAGYYLTNILMAALAGIFLYFIAKALVPGIDQDRANALALTSALMFVASPLHCEDVCWISGRADLLAAPFFLGALLCAIFARDWTTGKINWRFYLLSLVAFAFSLMSKEAAVTLPVVVAALFVLAPSAPPVYAGYAGSSEQTQGREGHDNDGSSGDGPISDGKDQHIKKRKKVKGGIQKYQAELQGIEIQKKDTEKDAVQSGNVKKERGETGPAKVEVAAKEKTDWLTWSKHFVLFLTPYGALTIVYLFVRQKALGSFIGGYSGDMGEALSKWILFRWFDPVNLLRIAFPVAKNAFHIFGISSDQTPSVNILGTIYAIILTVLLVRLLTQRLNWRLPLFLSLWLIASTVPLVTLWGLDADLHNQRVLYLYTAPMVMILPALVFLPKLSDRPAMKKEFFVLTPDMEAFLAAICAWCFYAFTICLIVFSALVSYNWVLAGRQMEAIQNQSAALIGDLAKGPDNKILVVRVPKDYLGAHVLLGGVNMIELLEPPLTREHISQHLVTFQRALAGPSEPVSSVKLKRELSLLHDPKAYFWDVDRRQYQVVKYAEKSPATPESIVLPIATSASEANKPGVLYPVPAQKGLYKFMGGAPAIDFNHLTDTGGDGLVITGLDINPLSFDFVQLTLSIPHAPTALGVYLTFDDQEDAKAPFSEKPQVCKMLQLNKAETGTDLKEKKLDFKVSHYGEWYSYNKIKRLKITFSNVGAVAVSRVSMADDAKLAPFVGVVDGAEGACGEYVYAGEPVKFVADARLVPGAKSFQVEISQVNRSWDAFVTADVEGPDPILNRSYNVPLVGRRAFFQLDPRVYGDNGFYDVRVAVVNDKNQIVSDWSDVVTLYRPGPTGAKAPFCADY
jgi:hypothetical protein